MTEEENKIFDEIRKEVAMIFSVFDVEYMHQTVSHFAFNWFCHGKKFEASGK